MRLFQRAVDLVATPTVGAAFGAASFARRARVFHPDGAAFQATVELSAGAPAVGGSALAGAGRHRAVIRLSRGAGLPAPMPDVLGFALRVVDAHGPARHQDLLLVTSAAPAIARHVIVAGRQFGAGFYSSILPYRHAEELVMFGVRPLWADGIDLDSVSTATFDDVATELSAGRLRFEVLAAGPTTPWTAIGVVDGGRRLSAAEQESLRFNVCNTGEALQPAGLLNAVRRSVYVASQTARPTPMADPTSADTAA